MLGAIQVNFYFYFLFFLIINYTKFTFYKLVIYFLNNFLLNLCLLYVLVLLYFFKTSLNINFFFFIILLTISETKILFPFNSGLYFYFTTFFNPALQVGLVLYHPPLFYLSFLFFLTQVYKPNFLSFVSHKINLVVATLALILGGFWGWSAFTWGFYWVFDLIEIMLLILVLAIIWKMHKRFIYFSYFLLPLFVVFQIIFTLRLGLISTRHSFFTKKKILKYIYYILFYCATLSSYYILLGDQKSQLKILKISNLLLTICFIKKFYIYLFLLFLGLTTIIQLVIKLNFNNLFLVILHGWLFYFIFLLTIQTTNYMYHINWFTSYLYPRVNFYHNNQALGYNFRILKIELKKKLNIFMFEVNTLKIRSKYTTINFEDIFQFNYNELLNQEKQIYYSTSIIKTIGLKVFLYIFIYMCILFII